MSVLGLFTDNSLKDGTGDDIGGAEVDLNPEILANILDGTTIEALGTVAAVQFTAIDINGGTIDGTTVGATAASTGAFTTLSTTGVFTAGGNIVSDTDSTDDLGSASVRWATSFQDDSVSRFTAHDPTIATDKTLSSTYNWGTFGPTTIGSGITVTVASGATWTVV